jgi:hypothetical protein
MELNVLISSAHAEGLIKVVLLLLVARALSRSGVRLMLAAVVVWAALTAFLNKDEKRRKDAQKVLKLLRPLLRRSRRQRKSPPDPAAGDASPPSATSSRRNRVWDVPAVTCCRRENRPGSPGDVDGAWWW